jgi:hypothetical protein
LEENKITRQNTLTRAVNLRIRFFAVPRIRRRTALAITVAVVVFGLVLGLVSVELLARKETKKNPEVLVGVDVGFGDENDVYKVADATKGFVNLIIVGSLNVTNDTAKLTRVCDYLYRNKFHFIIYVGFRPGIFPPRGPDSTFVQEATNRWGNKFLGLYIFDEPGGKQLGYNKSNADKIVSRADNNSDAALHYVMSVNGFLLLYHDFYYNASNVNLFTSDYGLYWYDYLCGYNSVFGEFVGNQSRQLAVALTRGAANQMGKDWGVMITWKYNQPPFLEEPEQLYQDMVSAYQNGARYIIVFDSSAQFPSTTQYGILTQQHLDAMKRFWDYTKSSPRTGNSTANVAYVLPMDYGFGFRKPDDNTWGLWPADALSAKVWNDTNSLVQQYGMNLDVVYETKIENIPITLPYSKLIFWNGTTLER